MKDSPKPNSTEFVSIGVPGLPDGHPLRIRPHYEPSMGFEPNGFCEFLGHRRTNAGVDIVVTIPATAANFDKYVRTEALTEESFKDRIAKGERE